MARITVTVRRFEYGVLKTKLTPHHRIMILSCDSCAKLCKGLGGEQGLKSLTDKLVADGFNVVHRELLPVACSPEQLTSRLDDEANRKLFEEADVIIALTCRSGIERARETLPGLRILEVTKTLGKGTFSPDEGARLTEPLEGIEIEIDDAEGITLAEAATRLGLCPGSF